ncbi:hypothetical protein BD410DRAFT_785458 [Rickenella mellea]|uniref:Uncharacterized protein n=1 Tax=Rickenella mellea TaxID=50990 RepID=A0A4Y7QAP7_9AGAM|nr:hypothetical protein BD410DRAFT_785458 [Rickenella mellea]
MVATQLRGESSTGRSSSLTSKNSRNMKTLVRRKGGGGHGGGLGSSGHGSSSHGSSGAAKSHGASSTYYKSSYAQPFSISYANTQVGAYGDGKGKKFKLGPKTPFPGRLAGSGSRSQIYGTSRYGSGYPYGATGSYVSGRPFPFIFYPIALTENDYYGSTEYLNLNATSRPGGLVVEAVIQPLNNTSGVTYRIVGDNSSVAAVYAALATNCSIANPTITNTTLVTFNPGTYPLPEQVVQWYRASSFALSLDSYNNSAALLSNMPASTNQSALPLSFDTPLPAGLNATFLTCLNSTIAASVPLRTVNKLTAGDIVYIVFYSLSALLSLIFIAWPIYRAIWIRRHRNDPAATPPPVSMFVALGHCMAARRERRQQPRFTLNDEFSHKQPPMATNDTFVALREWVQARKERVQRKYWPRNAESSPNPSPAPVLNS